MNIHATRILTAPGETGTEGQARRRAAAKGGLAGMLDGTEWHTDASCRNHPHPEWWFPEVGGVQAREAKAICKECPVGEACGEWAIATKQEYGLWGTAGLNAKAIKRIRRERGLTVNGVRDPLSNRDDSQ